MAKNKHALVLFSGGQDSATCLAWALSQYEAVETIGFQYGQRHAVEMTIRPDLLENLRKLSGTWNQRLGEDHIIDLSFISELSETALTRDVEIQFSKNGLPNTFVPGRNLLFLTVASMLAYRRGMHTLIGGMSEADFSGYPDCRDDTIKAMQTTLHLGLAVPMAIETPLMWKSKKEIWQMAYSLGGESLVSLIRTKTHTCYLGDRSVLHDWGYGCGQCPACQLRIQGYRQFQAS